MSVIVIVLEKEKFETSALMKLQKAIGGTLQFLKSTWMQEQPLIEMEIFEGDYQEKAKVLRGAIKVIEDEDLVARYYELPYDAKYKDDAQVDTWKVSADFVKAMLAAADDEIERQLDN